MYSGVATGIFAIRNADKTSSENIGRLPVTIGQTASLIKAGAQYNNSVSKTTKTVLNNLKEVAKSDKVFNGLGKVVNFAADNINPLIVASSGLTVALADKEDRKKTIITEACCLAGMFTGEGWMKKNLDKYLEKLPVNKKLIPIIKGVTFVVGSITSSNIGEKVGKTVAEYWDKPLIKDNFQAPLKNDTEHRTISLKS